MLRRHPATWMLALFVFVGACFVTSAWAATIIGTSKDEVLWGTSGADTIHGNGGNDKLYGLGGNDYLNGGQGNDYLNGGPGADQIICGPGRDTVIADSSDKVAKDCEVVKELKPSGKELKPAGKAANVVPGRYCGFTSQGMSICFTVTADGHRFTQGHFAMRIDCTPASTQEQTIDMPDAIPIGANGSFDYRVTRAGQVAKEISAPKGLVGTYLRGRIDSAGNAQGQAHLSKFSFTASDTRYACQTADATWSAKKQ